MSIAKALTIAGSDSGGGAGIQADLRTFAMHCVHGMSAITCVTAQNTVAVEQVAALAPEMVVAQIMAVRSDIGVDAAKTGMLLNAPIMDAIAATLTQTPLANLVVDPVMVSRTGAVLIDEDAIATLKTRMLPLAAIVTPNRYEAELLTGLKMDSVQAMEQAARQIQTLGPQMVLVKGGSFTGALRGTDVWFDGERCEVLTAVPIDTPHTHGTGCTLSAAIAAHLALGRDRRTAVVEGKRYVSEALGYALAIGAGTGPVGHFYPLLARS